MSQVISKNKENAIEHSVWIQQVPKESLNKNTMF